MLGFLQSSADFRADHEIAREYLTPSARQRWRPQAGTVIYDGIAPPADGRRDRHGRGLRGGPHRRARAASGARRPGPRSAAAFGMEQVDGEWRIATLDDGLMLSAANADETYRQVSLYFLAPTGGSWCPTSCWCRSCPA